MTDPPYGLAMNGAAWDGDRLASGEGFQAFTRWWAEQAIRVLRPGAYLAASCAPRTVHRLVAGLEEAGFEIRDQLLWLYGSGVPKSRRLPGGRSASLKPAYEPIVLARRPLDRATPTLASNLARHGTGALNVDTARIATRPSDPRTEGYWPANLALSHDVDCDQRRGECVPDCVVPMIDRLAAQASGPDAPAFSRLFYAAKAGRAEREAGLDHLPQRRSPVFVRPGGGWTRANTHPTVKPLSLMRWLVRLVVPPGGLVLDPFAGSGSTGIAALLERRPFLGIEAEAEYVTIARARLAHWAEHGEHGARSGE